MKYHFSLFIVMAVFMVVSCSDIFREKEAQSISLTIPALMQERSHGAQFRAATQHGVSPWTIYAFACGEAMIANKYGSTFFDVSSIADIENIVTRDGVLRKAVLKEIDLSKPVEISLGNIAARTNYFVVVFITYDEYVVFRGVSPDDIIADSGLSKPLHTVKTGVNEISLELKKNTDVPVYFISQSGYEIGKNNDGSPQIIDAKKSTPRKPTTYNAILHNANGADTAVVILTEDITLEPDIAYITICNDAPIKNLSFASLMSGHYSLAAESMTLDKGGSLSLTDIDIRLTIANDYEKYVTLRNKDALLEIGGAVEISRGIKLYGKVLSETPGVTPTTTAVMPPLGQITITSPLSGSDYKVSVELNWGTIADKKTKSEQFLNAYETPILKTTVLDGWMSRFTLECIYDTPATTGIPSSFPLAWKHVAGGWTLVPKE